MADIIIHSGGNIQAAVNSANIGDNIIIDVATFDFSTPLNLPVKSGCTGSSYVTIKSAELASIDVPVNALRDPMSGATLAHMPILRTTSTTGEPVVTVSSGAGCYRFQGIYFTNNTTVGGIAYITLNGGGSHFVFDRCAIIPKDYPYSAPYNTTAKIGIVANATDVTVQNCDIRGFYGLPPGTVEYTTAVDTEGILVEVGPCKPCLFDNNYIEAWFDPIFLGGADPPATATGTIASGATLTAATLSDTTGLSVGMTIALQAVDGYPDECNHPPTAESLCYGDGIVQTVDHGTGAITYTSLIAQQSGTGNRVNLTTTPVTGGVAQWNGQKIQDVTITHNHIHLPTEFSAVHNAAAIGAGIGPRCPKSFIEIKFVDGLLYEGNYHDGFWSNWGFASYNQNGGGVWTSEQDITLRNNWFNGFNLALSIPMADPYYLNTKGNNITIENNLWTNPDNDNVTLATPSSFVMSGHQGGNLTVRHNTILTGYPATYTGKTIQWDHCPGDYYGPTGPVTFKDNLFGAGNYGFVGEDGTFGQCWPTLTQSNNLVYNNAGGTDGIDNFNSQFPGAGNIALSGDGTAVLFVGSDPSDVNDWVLQSGSAGHNAASDGTDIGCNIATLITALGGGGGETASVVTSGKVTMSGKVTIS